MPGATPGQRIATACVVLAVFLSTVVGGVYGGLGRDVPEAFPFLSTMALALSVYNWFWHYSRAYRIPWVMDMGWFVIGAWMLVVPYYIIKTEGRAGVGRIGLFALTYFAAWVVAIATSIWVAVLLGAE